MNGKSKCKILKDIRRKIAAENDIEYVTSECKYQGDCSGTCPKCEAEVRYLENELEKRRKAGKAVAVAGIAATLVIGTSGCDFPFLHTTAGAPMPASNCTQEQHPSSGAAVGSEELPGEVYIPEDTQSCTALMGALLPPDEIPE